jgi:hypothetical protein
VQIESPGSLDRIDRTRPKADRRRHPLRRYGIRVRPRGCQGPIESLRSERPQCLHFEDHDPRKYFDRKKCFPHRGQALNPNRNTKYAAGIADTKKAGPRYGSGILASVNEATNNQTGPTSSATSRRRRISCASVVWMTGSPFQPTRAQTPPTTTPPKVIGEKATIAPTTFASPKRTNRVRIQCGRGCVHCMLYLTAGCEGPLHGRSIRRRHRRVLAGSSQGPV